MRDLNSKESLVIKNLVGAWNAYIELPNIHADDTREFRTGIHMLQDKIMSRPSRGFNESKLPNFHYCGAPACRVRIFNPSERYCGRHEGMIRMGIQT